MSIQDHPTSPTSGSPPELPGAAVVGNASGPGILDSILSLDVSLKRLQEDNCEFGMIMTHYIRGQFKPNYAYCCDELAVTRQKSKAAS
ncbi:uncharacterized protein N7487_010322 [Penicillium crustosum]|uniref:uncharacterized protein n=1 Tax=Penicillium crustosum TaxID=36656 RepID=UPI002389263D|nr:uncharacterized protein N7487_010322 [Penicillium crustosum]KAJ5396019.1 hypothetical protein N7487_010322 [Penicillium crustosum]